MWSRCGGYCFEASKSQVLPVGLIYLAANLLVDVRCPSNTMLPTNAADDEYRIVVPEIVPLLIFHGDVKVACCTPMTAVLPFSDLISS